MDRTRATRRSAPRLVCLAALAAMLVGRYAAPGAAAAADPLTATAQDRAALLRGLADALVKAIRHNDIQPLRARIATGGERYRYALRSKGGSLPSVAPRFTHWFTGHVIAEIEHTVAEIHREIRDRELDPRDARLHGAPVVEWGNALRWYVAARLDCGGPRPVRLFFSAKTRRVTGGKAVMILDGGGIFGGVCFAWLTDDELRELRKREDEAAPSYAARIAPLILRHRLHYRWVLLRSRLPHPDPLRQRSAAFRNNMADGYIELTHEQRAALRRGVTFSQWPSLDERGKEYLRILFDESGNASQVFLGGRPIQAPRSEEPDGQ